VIFHYSHGEGDGIQAKNNEMIRRRRIWFIIYYIKIKYSIATSNNPGSPNMAISNMVTGFIGK
jgi:hypothetical protein